ncbi:MAG TPA: superinfection immunity protein [Candidatus Baltobacteraceae bacterium]|nr:superinfection immunity protein [Candidatus Baltobacteraceae bacterium]
MPDSPFGETPLSTKIVLSIALVGFYFLPTIMALVRRSERISAVVLLNTLLGWTTAGWIIAMILAMTGDSRRVPNYDI